MPTNPKRSNLLISVPVYGGLLHFKCTSSLLNLARYLTEKEVAHRFQFISNDALIPRIRTRFANIALYDRDRHGRAFTHLLFIDADISFEARNAYEMLKADKPIVALPYSTKGINWYAVAQAARQGAPPETLPQYAASPCLNYSAQPLSMTEASPVRHAGTGAMLIQTAVFAKLAQEHPERKYKMCAAEIAERGTNLTEAFDFFPIGVYPETAEYLSEDYYFIEDARKSGFETYILPWAVTDHIGSYEYKANLPAIANLNTGAALTPSNPSAVSGK